MKQIITGIGVVALVAALAGCAGTAPEVDEPAAADCEPTTAFETVTPGVLTVVGINAVPKFNAQSADGPYEGFDGELIQIFADENCLDLVVKPLAPPAAVLDMQDGKSDLLIGGILKSPARGEQFGMTETDLTFETMGIVSKDGYDDLDELDGLQIGVVSGSTYIEPLKARYGADRVTEYQSETNAISDLNAGRIQALAVTSMSGWYQTTIADGLESHIVAEDSGEEVLTGLMSTGWLYAKDGADPLGAAASEFFTRIHDDGTLEKVLENQDLENIDFYLNGTR